MKMVISHVCMFNLQIHINIFLNFFETNKKNLKKMFYVNPCIKHTDVYVWLEKFN